MRGAAGDAGCPGAPATSASRVRKSRRRTARTRPGSGNRALWVVSPNTRRRDGGSTEVLQARLKSGDVVAGHGRGQAVQQHAGTQVVGRFEQCTVGFRPDDSVDEQAALLLKGAHRVVEPGSTRPQAKLLQPSLVARRSLGPALSPSRFCPTRMVRISAIAEPLVTKPEGRHGHAPHPGDVGQWCPAPEGRAWRRRRRGQF